MITKDAGYRCQTKEAIYNLLGQTHFSYDTRYTVPRSGVKRNLLKISRKFVWETQVKYELYISLQQTIMILQNRCEYWVHGG